MTGFAGTTKYIHIEKGAPLPAIVWWSRGPSKVESFAASDLQKYIGIMSGCEVSVLEGTTPGSADFRHVAGALIVIEGHRPEKHAHENTEAGYTIPENLLASADAGLAGAKDDSFLIEVSGNILIMAGTSGRGVLYAAYELLQRCGVRFDAPNFNFYEGHAEYVPSGAQVKIPLKDIKSEPSFKYRRKYVEEGWSHTPHTLIQLIDWMAKNKLNTLVYPMDYLNQGLNMWKTWRLYLIPELEKRGMMLEVGGHGYDSFLPEKKYRIDHPEWFPEPITPAVDDNERHRPDRVFYMAEESALQAYIDNVIAYLREYPEISIFDAWPPDGAIWSERDIDRFGSIPNAQAYVTNRLRTAVSEALPGVKIETISYVPATDPPDPAFMYHPDIIVDFAPYDRSYGEPIFQSPHEKNRYYIRLLTAWRDAGFQGDMGIYEYYAKYSWHSLPVALPILISKEIPYYAKELKVNGLGIYSEPANWLVYELNHLLTAALSWNAELDADSFFSDYLNGRFGAASAEMAVCYELAEQAGKLLFDRPGGNYADLSVVAAARDAYLRARSAVAEAFAITGPSGTPGFLAERLGWNLDFAIADTEIAYFRLTGDGLRAGEAERRTEELVEAHVFDGIVLKSMWTKGRYNPDIFEWAGRARTLWVYGMYRDQW